MQQLPKPEESIDDSHDNDPAPITNDLDNALDAFIKDVLRFIDRDMARKRPLPRSAEFAITFQASVAPLNDRDGIKPPAPGTDLRPDDDVREMDATVPRAPEPEPEG